MGILEQLTGQIKGKLGLPQSDDEPQGPPNELIAAVMAMMSGSGGLSGLLQKLGDSGLQEQVASWVGGGNNKTVTAGQIHGALGDEQVSQIARQSGLSSEQAASSLAQLLPQLVNRLTPDGQVPQGDEWQGMAGKLIGSQWFGRGQDSH